MSEVVEIEKLVHGGQGLATLEDGRKVFVWGAIPGERVEIELKRNKKSYAEAVTTKVIKASKFRVEPAESNYLATSPWQIIAQEHENHWKKVIAEELFAQVGIKLPKFEVYSDGNEFGYRNKMEYSFWGDDEGVHLALYNRGSHQKQIVQGSALAMKQLDVVAQKVINKLNNRGVRAGDLKTIIVRSNQKNDVVAALFTKLEKFPKISLVDGQRGLRVYYSNPKSPAAVRTRLLYEIGDVRLEDKLLGESFSYDVDSFFQVNVPVFEQVLKVIKNSVANEDVVDMYSGVGSIGLSVESKYITLVENHPETAAMARTNAAGKNVKLIEASSEKALGHIKSSKVIIFDPPRAGLRQDVLNRLLEVQPKKIIYLSCNPATQARDITMLKDLYRIEQFEVFNFFPKTPHIESLAVLKLA